MSPSEAGAGDDTYTTVAEIPATANRDIDLLFVVDDSPSMLDKQNNLIANFPGFINILNTLEGGLPNLHIGVVSTDMGTKGTVVLAPGPGIGTVGQGGCAASGKNGVLQTNAATAMLSGNFISDIRQGDGTRLRNYTGNLADVFGNMARAGAGGCGFEQPLHAMRRALDGNPSNAGFLRPSALLGVVFLTDEDDCTIKDPIVIGTDTTTFGALQSFRCTRFGVTCTTGGNTPDEMNLTGAKAGCAANATSQFLDQVAPFRDFLVGLKPDARQVFVGAIMGTPEPYAVELRMPPGGGTAIQALAHSCMYQGAQNVEVGDPPARLKAFLDLFPGRNALTSICQSNLSGALMQISGLVANSIGSPCIGAAIADTNPGMPGLQPNCIVEDVDGATVIPIPACGSARPCWRFEEDPNCTLFDHLKLVVERTAVPPPSAVTRVRCVVP
jgi:hypothetical protein